MLAEASVRARPGVTDEFQSTRDEIQMNVAALVTWMVTILGGLLLLVIWLMEYDSEYQSTSATRLPVPVISAHALLGIAGLLLWGGYVLVDAERLAWVTIAVLAVVATLGLAMAARWIGVYRDFRDPNPSLTRRISVPPERKFPVPVVVAHGVLAVTTIVLVLFTVLGGS